MVHNIHVPNVGIIGTWWPISAAILILIFPGGFRPLRAYYYLQGPYYRAYLLSPPGCAVAEPRKKYSGSPAFL